VSKIKVSSSHLFGRIFAKKENCMNDQFLATCLKATGASNMRKKETIQNLWSGYGSIVRYALDDSSRETVIVKHVMLPKSGKHPRGWNTDHSHARKVKSYQVETEWYTNWSAKSDNSCRLPKCLATDTCGDEVLIVLEDMDAAGFPLRKSSVQWNDIELCLSWLAHFHATYMHSTPDGLWKSGTYWHLETRPDELSVLDDALLKKAASEIDQTLKSSPYQTVVHGDAKLANFCFSGNGSAVAAVDFQYVGGGVGMKDVAYFVGSCLYEEDCQRYEKKILAFYFGELKQAIEKRNVPVDFAHLEDNWRFLYPYAWTDFHRFLKGWSPGHWKINSYSEKLSRQVIAELGFA